MKKRFIEITLAVIAIVRIAFGTYEDYSAFKVACPQIWAQASPVIEKISVASVCRLIRHEPGSGRTTR
jgi:hypothetical protein